MMKISPTRGIECLNQNGKHLFLPVIESRPHNPRLRPRQRPHRTRPRPRPTPDHRDRDHPFRDRDLYKIRSCGFDRVVSNKTKPLNLETETRPRSLTDETETRLRPVKSGHETGFETRPGLETPITDFYIAKVC